MGISGPNRDADPAGVRHCQAPSKGRTAGPINSAEVGRTMWLEMNNNILNRHD